MRVVSDTSPLLNLAIVDLLDLLPAIYEAVYVPEAVVAELRLDSGLLGTDRLLAALGSEWLQVVAVAESSVSSAVRGQVDAGEAEAILLALQLGLADLLVDERAGRRLAAQLGLYPMGLLGLLLTAKERRLIERVEPAIDALREQAGFFVADSLREQVLRLARER
ncbi:MAG: DUF3368 domain-containing protein [Armatimonadetes bacterium]|nr:DUF3368 domain-containing protein [Armatimonadota bacterium]